MKTVPIDGSTLSPTEASQRVLPHPASVAHREGRKRHILHIHPDYRNHVAEIRSSLERFEGWGEIYPASGRHLLKIFDIGRRRSVFKLYKGISLPEGILYGLNRQSPGRRAYENAVRLIEMGVETPRPIGYVEDYGLLTLNRSLYIAQEHPSGSTLSTLFCRTRYFEQRKEAIRAFVRFILELQEKGITFRRLEADNVIFYQKGGSWFFSLLSTHHVDFKPSVGLRQKVNALSRLTAHEDSLRLLADEYALQSGEKPNDVFRVLKRACKAKK